MPEKNLANLDEIEKKLIVLWDQLTSDLVTLEQAETIARQAELLRHTAKTARMGEEWERNFFRLKIAAMIAWARLWNDAQKNKGGRPTDNPSSQSRGLVDPPTLEELGVSYDFSSNAQDLLRWERFIASYYEKADAQGWPYAIKGDRGILHHLGWEATREANARDFQKRREDAIKQAEAARPAARPAQKPAAESAARESAASQAGRSQPAHSEARSETTHSPKVEPQEPQDTPQVEPQAEPQAGASQPSQSEADTEAELPKVEIPAELLVKVKPPEPPPEMPKPTEPPLVERVKALLRTAFDPAGNEHEKENARRAIERADPRLETLRSDHASALHYMDLCNRITDHAKEQSNRYYNLYEKAQAKLREFQKIQDLIEKYEKRDRERLRVIRELKAENDRLKAELETLKRSATTPDPNHKTLH